MSKNKVIKNDIIYVKVHDLRQQLSVTLATLLNVNENEQSSLQQRLLSGVNTRLPPPSLDQAALLRQLVLAGAVHSFFKIFLMN